MLTKSPDDPVAANPSVLPAIFCGGIIIGTLDLAFAFISAGLRRGISPVRVLQSVASGLLGTESFQGGVGSAALGFALHFGIAFVVAAIYLIASRKLPILAQRAVPAGLLYGVGVFLVMNFVVLPLSAVPKRQPAPAALALECVGHMFLIGLPIALIARRHNAGARIAGV